MMENDWELDDVLSPIELAWYQQLKKADEIEEPDGENDD